MKNVVFLCKFLRKANNLMYKIVVIYKNCSLVFLFLGKFQRSLDTKKKKKFKWIGENANMRFLFCFKFLLPSLFLSGADIAEE